MTQSNGNVNKENGGAGNGNEQLGDLFNAGLLNEPIAAIEVSFN